MVEEQGAGRVPEEIRGLRDGPGVGDLDPRDGVGHEVGAFRCDGLRVDRASVLHGADGQGSGAASVRP
ncbi:hypothetical protein GCM10018783_20990 [Streptomyces griseosporeus]|nr:hypothetical protein GCM10018783_20990 [Streptomyces griseosporeus]